MSRSIYFWHGASTVLEKKIAKFWFIALLLILTAWFVLSGWDAIEKKSTGEQE
jgi:hypothetical protein